MADGHKAGFYAQCKMQVDDAMSTLADELAKGQSFPPAAELLNDISAMLETVLEEGMQASPPSHVIELSSVDGDSFSAREKTHHRLKVVDVDALLDMPELREVIAFLYLQDDSFNPASCADMLQSYHQLVSKMQKPDDDLAVDMRQLLGILRYGAPSPSFAWRQGDKIPHVRPLSRPSRVVNNAIADKIQSVADFVLSAGKGRH